MAENFKVTREFAQQFAELGAAQLPKGFIPPYDEFFSGLIKELINHPWPFSEEATASKRLTLERLEGLEAWWIIEQLIKLNGSTFSFAALECDVRGGKYLNRDIHNDSFGQNISFLWMPSATDDTLRTFGRGPDKPDESSRPEMTFSYSGGPIILTGKDYGKSLVDPRIPTGATWHQGKGSTEGDKPFFAIDFFTN
jgi:hypothetical protein